MAIKNMIMRGIRSFKDETKIEFAVPNGKKGSGLNIIVGSNNSGKSTIIESMNIISNNDKLFSSDVRNKNSEKTCKIDLNFVNGDNYSMESIDNEGAFANKTYNGGNINGSTLPILLLSTNRYFSHYFQNSSYSTYDYMNNILNQRYRTDDNNKYHNFGGRILEIFEDGTVKNKYTKELKKVFPDIPKWNIDSYNNELEIKFPMNNSPHNSNGAGQGLNNLFLIVDSYLNFDENVSIVIDEPEISLHPDIQKNLFSRLMEISSKKQIIITTHSPYLVNFNVLENGGKIFRVVKDNDCSNIYELDKSDYSTLSSFFLNLNNPHILSLEAREILFLHDNVILVEGQDDVIAYKKILSRNAIDNQVSFFGWGVGGYDNFSKILDIMKKLGYKKIFCIADGDEGAKKEIETLKNIYNDYEFYNIKAEDIRDKKLNANESDMLEAIEKEINDNETCNKDLLEKIKEYMLRRERNGLVNDLKDCNIKEEYLDDVDNLISNIKTYFNTENENVSDDIEGNSNVSKKLLV